MSAKIWWSDEQAQFLRNILRRWIRNALSKPFQTWRECASALRLQHVEAQARISLSKEPTARRKDDVDAIRAWLLTVASGGVLKGVGKGAQEAACRGMLLSRQQAGEPIFTQGGVGNEYVIILSGAVDLFYDDGLEHKEPGDKSTGADRRRRSSAGDAAAAAIAAAAAQAQTRPRGRRKSAMWGVHLKRLQKVRQGQVSSSMLLIQEGEVRVVLVKGARGTQRLSAICQARRSLRERRLREAVESGGAMGMSTNAAGRRKRFMSVADASDVFGDGRERRGTSLGGVAADLAAAGAARVQQVTALRDLRRRRQSAQSLSTSGRSQVHALVGRAEDLVGVMTQKLTPLQEAAEGAEALQHLIQAKASVAGARGSPSGARKDWRPSEGPALAGAPVLLPGAQDAGARPHPHPLKPLLGAPLTTTSSLADASGFRSGPRR
eukprot:g241.t1